MAVVSRFEERNVPDGNDGARCPFLEVVTGDQAQRYPGGVNCQRRRGRERVPSRDELQWFCASGHHQSCVTFRRWRGA
jgi:hypothetical protein